MRAFLSPGERRFLRELEPYPLEVAFVLELMETFDARLDVSEEPPRMRRYRQLTLDEQAEARERIEAIAP